MNHELYTEFMCECEKTAALLYPAEEKSFRMLIKKLGFKTSKEYWSLYEKTFGDRIISDNISFTEIIDAAGKTNYKKRINLSIENQVRALVFINGVVSVAMSKAVNQAKKQGVNEELKNLFLKSASDLKQFNLDAELMAGTKIFDENIANYLNKFIQQNQPFLENKIIDSKYIPSSFNIYKMYSVLLQHGFIQENLKFIDNFQGKCDCKTVWLGKQTQLIYLFYLIYDSNEYMGKRLQQIIPELFIKPDGMGFKEANLNTQYNQLLPVINNQKAASAHLKTIQKLIESIS